LSRFARIAATASFALLLLTSGCTSPDSPSATREDSTGNTSVPQQKIVFDMGHGEIFGPDDATELGQSQAIAQMRSSGFDVAVNADQITEEDLSSAAGLVIAGPMRPLLREEYVAINDFLERGGTVLLTIHVPFPVFAIPAHWGLPVQPYVIAADEPLPGVNDTGVLLADVVEDGRLTEGVNQILIVSGWPVSATDKGAYLAVSSGIDTWIDADASRSREESEAGPHGVVGASGVGRGTVIVVGDDAVFANVALGQADNAKLLDNILQLMHTQLES